MKFKKKTVESLTPTSINCCSFITQTYFLTCLLLLFAEQSCFCLKINFAIDITVDLAINKAKLVGGKVAVGFLR